MSTKIRDNVSGMPESVACEKIDYKIRIDDKSARLSTQIQRAEAGFLREAFLDSRNVSRNNPSEVQTSILHSLRRPTVLPGMFVVCVTSASSITPKRTRCCGKTFRWHRVFKKSDLSDHTVYSCC